MMFKEKYGISEEEFVDIVKKIIPQLKLKDFKFGLYTEEDLAQEVYLEAFEAMERWDGVNKLQNFLFVNAGNRLNNLRRDKWYRAECPCKQCDKKPHGQTDHEDGEYCQSYLDWKTRNARKANISALPSFPDNFDSSSHEKSLDRLDIQEMQNIIDLNLPVKLRDIYLRMKDGQKVSNVDKTKLLKYLKKILK